MASQAGLMLGVVLSCGAAGACAAGPPTPPQAPAGSAPPTVVEVRRDARWDTVTRLRGADLSHALAADPAFAAARARDDAGALALRFVEAYPAFFRLAPPAALRVRAVTTDELGFAHVRLDQTYGGLEVWRGELLVQLDAERRVTRVQGHYAALPAALEVTPALSAAQAQQAAAAVLGAAACRACTATLGIAAIDPPRLAYRVVTRPSLAEGWVVTIDARDGAVLEQVPTVLSSPPR